MRDQGFGLRIAGRTLLGESVRPALFLALREGGSRA